MTLPASLPARLRAAGLEVVEIPGWRTRKRPGAFRPLGVLWHHTGGKEAKGKERAYADWMFLTGRNDLPAPLCQLSVDRNGTVYVGAAGRANHAGKAKASGPLPAGDGNELYVGVECHNNGSEGWSDAQYAAMVTLGRCLSAALGIDATAHRAHAETSVTGKWDPGRLDMSRFRAAIAQTAPTSPAPRPQEDEMNTNQEKTLNATFVEAEAAARRANMTAGGIDQVKAQLRTITATLGVLADQRDDAATKAKLDEILAALDLQSTALDAIAEAVDQAPSADVREALAQVQAKVAAVFAEAAS